jgi:glucose/arabinose dehydrogenase
MVCLMLGVAVTATLRARQANSSAVSGLPPGLVQQTIAESLDAPVSMAVAPDGRVLVCEQGGRLRVVRDGALLARPCVEVSTHAEVEEGLLGIAVPPGFPETPYFYLLYTVPAPQRHDRIVRYTISGDTALADSAITVFDLDPNVGLVHHGGRLRFGRDGMLYVTTGNQDIEELSQSLGSTLGKVLRIQGDGAIPSDNPFVATTSGTRRAIWARGFRNAFALDEERSTGRMFVTDVGGSEFEEINQVLPGANYGAPFIEGPGGAPRFRSPIHSYDHTQGCAITGGTFYDPVAVSFPRRWVHRYLFTDFCRGEIRWLDPTAPKRHGVLCDTGLEGLVDLQVGPRGELYALARGNSNPVGGSGQRTGVLVRISAAKDSLSVAPARP